MATVTLRKRRTGEYEVKSNGRLKAKHMNKDRAERFAKTLGWTKPHKKGSTDPKKTAVKLAKKPTKKATKKSK